MHDLDERLLDLVTRRVDDTDLVIFLPSATAPTAPLPGGGLTLNVTAKMARLTGGPARNMSESLSRDFFDLAPLAD